MTDPLHIERRGAVLEVILDRPKANAIAYAFAEKRKPVWTGR